MLRDRYEPINLFDLIPQLDLHLEPLLIQLDGLLEEDVLFARVREDLARRYPQTRTRGRPSTPVEVILRLLVVMRLYRWSFQQTEYFVNDSLVLRQFCRVYLERVPDDTTLIRWAQLIGPETLHQLNDRVVQLAHRLKVTRGRQLRVDTTVVQTNIHYPTDSGLLGDGVRVLSRCLRRAKGVLGRTAETLGLGREAFRSRVRTVRTLAQHLHRLTCRKGSAGAEALKAAYGRLIETAQCTAAQAQRVGTALHQARSHSAQRLVTQIETVLPRLLQGIQQARRRVIGGEVVPAKAKILSLFEPHTQIIPRYKPGQPVEFGRKLRLDEVEGGLITDYAIVAHGGGQDQPYLADSLAAHHHHFGQAPALLAADRGLASAKNVRLARTAGVKHIALPTGGRVPPDRWFRRGYRFRAGIEGRIHVLRRDYGLKRCRYHGEQGMGRWVGWGIVTHNLAKIAAVSAAR